MSVRFLIIQTLMRGIFSMRSCLLDIRIASQRITLSIFFPIRIRDDKADVDAVIRSMCKSQLSMSLGKC
jgi:hypothetical protein